MSEIFISYARVDGIYFAETLEAWLESNEVRIPTFRDITNIEWGDDWKYVIDTRIEKCFAMIVVVTPRAIVSPFVTYEWAYALGKGKRVLPLIISPEINEKSLHPRMADLNVQQFDNPTQDDWGNLKRKLLAFQSEDDTPTAVTKAIEELDNPDQIRRLQALESLRSIDHPTVIRALKSAISHHYQDVRANAGIALAQETNYRDNDAIPALKEALHLPGKEFNRAVSCLIRMNNDAAAECLFTSYETVQSHRKTEISNSLVQFSDPCVVPYLRNLWHSGNRRPNIIEKLAVLKDDVAINDIIKFINSLNEQQGETKLKFLQLLIEFGNHPDIVNLLFEVMRKHITLRYQWEHRMFELSIETLENFGTKEIIERLELEIKEPQMKHRHNYLQMAVHRMKQKQL